MPQDAIASRSQFLPHAKRTPPVCSGKKEPPHRTLCHSQKSRIGNPSPDTVVHAPRRLFPIALSGCQIIPRPTRQASTIETSIRAAARVARSLADLLLVLSLPLEFRLTSAPRVDEPVAYLCTFHIVSSFAPPPRSQTDLSHC